MFKKYPSLENHYRQKFIDKIRVCPEFSSTETVFIVTEKIHGANFQFNVSDDGIRIGSRNNFVDGTFYNCQSVIDKYNKSAEIIFEYLKNTRNAKSIIIYGELFGGVLQGKSEHEAKIIQGGIQYISFNDFLVFDIFIRTETDEFFMSFYDVINIFQDFARSDDKKNQFRTVPYFTMNTLDECLKYPNDGNSKIPAYYGYELPNNIENIMEGIVIRPFEKDIYLSNGSRVIIKSKNEKWSEKQKVKKPKYEFTHPLQPLILEYINVNRLNAVLSKIGGIESLSIKDFGKVLSLYSKDVLGDCIKDEVLPQDYNKNVELKHLNSWLNKQVKNLLMSKFATKV